MRRSLKRQRGFWGAVISAAGSLAGSAMASGSSAKSVRDQMTFQYNMATTAHQREVADLRAAGLNPILSGTGGPGGATPAGASMTMPDVITPAINTGLAAERNRADVDNIEAETKRKTAETRTLENQWFLQNADIYLKNAQSNTEFRRQQQLEQETHTERENTQQVRHLAEIARNSAIGARTEGEIDESRYGQGLRYIRRALDAAGGAASAYRNLRSGGQGLKR